MDVYIIISIFSFLLTAILTPGMIILSKKFGLVDDPKTRPHPAHTHTGVVPRGGGLPIFLGIVVPFLILLPVTKPIIGIFLGSALLVFIGLWDDIKDRSPYIRLVTNGVAVILAISFGLGIPYITNPFGGIIHLDSWVLTINIMGIQNISVFNCLFTFILIYWMTNIIGWSGGVDGQLPGFVSIASLVIGFLSLRFVPIDKTQIITAAIAFATFGAFLGFLPWNFFPQKIMPGYAGKTLAGFMLASLSILSFSKLGTTLLVLAVPLTDAIIILSERIISGKSPVLASVGHLHHHLLFLGWSKKRISIFYWTISGVAGIIALNLKSTQKVFAVFIFFIIVFGFVLMVNALSKLKKMDN